MEDGGQAELGDPSALKGASGESRDEKAEEAPSGESHVQSDVGTPSGQNEALAQSPGKKEAGKPSEESRDQMEAPGGGQPNKWPTKVSFREDDPKKGMVYLVLTLDGLETQVPLYGEGIALNGEVLEKSFENRMVTFRMEMTSGKENGRIYEYKKCLPYEIDPKETKDGTKMKFEKDGRVKLRLKKMDAKITWAHKKDDLMVPDKK